MDTISSFNGSNNLRPIVLRNYYPKFSVQKFYLKEDYSPGYYFFNSHQRLNVEHLIESKLFQEFTDFNSGKITKHRLNSPNMDTFYQWLVGFTDGDGTFSIVRQNNKWSLTFQISQNSYNLRVLHYIKSQLNVGSVYSESNRSMSHFRIRDLASLETVIFPIFDKYPLLTTKHFNYLKLKEAHAILKNKSLNPSEKDTLIFNIIDTKPPLDYISPAWSVVNNNVSNFESASKVMSKGWLIGFTEAEGSFYLVAKAPNRLVHAFEITQKLDTIVLIAIKYILGISSNVKFNKSGFFTIATTNSRAIENIIQFFGNKNMKGIKSVEFSIWSRSYTKHKGDFLALNKIRNIIRSIKLKYSNSSTLKGAEK